MPRPCASCKQTKPRSCFGTHQWSKGEGSSRCKGCVTSGGPPSRQSHSPAGLPDGLAPLPSNITCTSHTVLVVDNSGSMRETDIQDSPGVSRSQAVYRCIAESFVPDQLKRGCSETDLCTLIEFDTQARTIFTRIPWGKQLQDHLRTLGTNARPRDHGNYIPAIELAWEVLLKDARCQHTALSLVFLSDGRPSDSPPKGPGDVTTKHCGLMQLLAQRVYQSLHVSAIQPNRFHMSCLGFGRSLAEFSVLQSMASGLPSAAGKFEHICLDMSSISSALSSVTDSLTETRASVLPPEKQRDLRHVSQESNETRHRWAIDDCDIYRQVFGLKQEDPSQIEQMVDTVLVVRKACCNKGSERVVHQALLADGHLRPKKTNLVVKESKYLETCPLDGLSFHVKFLELHSAASQLATIFNQQHNGICAEVRFVEGEVIVHVSKQGDIDKFFFLEEFLDGEYTKWNNNNGFVKTNWSPTKQSNRQGHDDEHVPQAFSHWTYHHTGGKRLVCDLQGVFKAADRYNDNSEFVLTDPVIHSETKGTYGRTDRGRKGMDHFFLTHQCNDLCKALGLPDTNQGIVQQNSSSPSKSLSDTSVPTSLVSVEPLPHCVQRMGERDVEKKQLQSARKYGVIEQQRGSRKKYEDQGMVVITDETGRKVVTAYRKAGRYVSVLAASSRAWATVVAPHTGFGAQDMCHSNVFPESWVREKQSQNYQVTALAVKGDEWSVVMSTDSGIDRQVIAINPWCTAWINEQWDKHYRISACAALPDNHGWCVVMSTFKAARKMSSQTLYGPTRTWPADWIQKQWRDKKRVTSCAGIGSECVVVMSSNSGFGGQTYKIDENWPVMWVKEQEAKGYYITACCYLNRNWCIVMSELKTQNNSPHQKERAHTSADWSSTSQWIRMKLTE